MSLERSYSGIENGLPEPDRVLPLGELLFDVDRSRAPRLVLEPGQVVAVETEDAFGGQIRRPGDRRDRAAMPESNPATGPIAVAGAEPGDDLVVEVLAIEPSLGQCCTYVWPYAHARASVGEEVEHQTRICPIEAGAIRWSDALSIPYAPLVGVLAVAPADDVPTTEAAGDHGGNLDLREIGPGATVRLPVQVPGAMLVLGDCHAAQGAGELSAAALEMPARVLLRVGVIPRGGSEGVRVETADEIGVAAVALPLEHAVEEAYARLVRILASDFGWNPWEAYALLTQVGEISLGYYRGGIAMAKVARAIAERR